MNGITDVHAASSAAALMHHHQQLQLGVPFPPTSIAADPASPAPQAKPRLPGLPPTPPTPPTAPSHAFGQGAGDACIDDSGASRAHVGLPPRKAHRRSRSDVPFGYFQPSGHLPPPKMEGNWGLPGDADGASADELFNAYFNLDGLEGLNSSDERHDDGDSRGSSMKTNGADSSENESEELGADSRGGRSGIRLWADGAEKRELGVKRNAIGDPAPRHARSLSMDSLMGKLNFAAAAPESAGMVRMANSVNLGPNKFNLEFGSGGFTPAETKKIMADEKLAEMALADPKRVKRVLANRQSAARSKERKMRYIAELEQKVQILQTEATTLSTQLSLLQRDSAGLATQNNELRFRLQAMEQQAQLRDALNEALTAEVQRLKLAATELGDSCSPNSLAQQIQLNSQNHMFQLQQQQQGTPIPFYRQQQPQQNGAATENESKE